MQIVRAIPIRCITCIQAFKQDLLQYKLVITITYFCRVVVC